MFLVFFIVFVTKYQNIIDYNGISAKICIFWSWMAAGHLKMTTKVTTQKDQNLQKSLHGYWLFDGKKIFTQSLKLGIYMAIFKSSAKIA